MWPKVCMCGWVSTLFVTCIVQLIERKTSFKSMEIIVVGQRCLTHFEQLKKNKNLDHATRNWTKSRLVFVNVTLPNRCQTMYYSLCSWRTVQSTIPRSNYHGARSWICQDISTQCEKNWRELVGTGWFPCFNSRIPWREGGGSSDIIHGFAVVHVRETTLESGQLNWFLKHSTKRSSFRWLSPIGSSFLSHTASSTEVRSPSVLSVSLNNDY